MILFNNDSAYKILMGQKTMTARFWLTRRAKPGSVHWAQLNLFPESRFARLQILSVEEWDGVSADQKFAEKEGFESSTEFLCAYWNLNEHNWDDPDRTHYKIEFRVVHVCQPTPMIKIDGEPTPNPAFIYNYKQLPLFYPLEE